MRISDWSSDVCSSDLIKCDGVHGAFVVVFVDLQTIANVQRPAQLIYEHALANQVIVHQLAFVRVAVFRSEEHTSELQSLMRISYAVFCLKKKKKQATKLCENTVQTSDEERKSTITKSNNSYAYIRQGRR